MQEQSKITLYLGEVWEVTTKPFGAKKPGDCFRQIKAGALAVDHEGKILGCDEASSIKRQFPDATVRDFGQALILPGFVDSHIHFPQTEVIGSYGQDLLGWLNGYTFPRESEFSNKDIAKTAAKRFFDETLSNGVTTAAVYGTNHESATDLFFEEADKRGSRVIAGKASMDRFAPEILLQNADQCRSSTESLIKKWHKKNDRLFYAITPRFAPTSSEPALRMLGQLKVKYPDLYVQTHHAENREEVAWVKKLFPHSKNYLDVYDEFGLLGKTTLLAHSIYATKEEMNRIKETESVVVHCPTSNLFLGSGLFPMDKHKKRHGRIALGTDVGGGTSFSMWQTMAEAYKVQRIRKPSKNVSPVDLFYMATLGGAEALSLDHITGNFSAGKAADFQVLDPTKKPLLAERLEETTEPLQRLFATFHLADDRVTKAVYVQGREVYKS